MGQRTAFPFLSLQMRFTFTKFRMKKIITGHIRTTSVVLIKCQLFTWARSFLMPWVPKTYSKTHKNTQEPAVTSSRRFLQIQFHVCPVALQTQFSVRYIIINSTQQICILEANSRTAGEEIPFIFDTGRFIIVCWRSCSCTCSLPVGYFS